MAPPVAETAVGGASVSAANDAVDVALSVKRASVVVAGIPTTRSSATTIRNGPRRRTGSGSDAGTSRIFGGPATLAHPAFADAIEDYLRRETAGIARYVDELNEHSPFRAPSSPPPS